MTKPEADGLGFYRFSVEQFHRLEELGFLSHVRVELLEGYLVIKEAFTPPRAAALGRAIDLFNDPPAGWTMRIQSPITLQDSEPEPDVAIVVGEPDDYAHRHPAPADVGFVLETADTTLNTDRVTKGRIYARAGILVYWLVNLPQRRLEMYTRPRAGNDAGYREVRFASAVESVTLNLGMSVVGPIAVADLLPPV